MKSLLLRRLVFALIALLCILYLSSLGLHMARGLPFGRALVEAGSSSAGYLWMLLHGDLGQSASRQREPIPAGPVITATIGKSLLLLAVALAIAAVLGIFLGGMAARRRRSPWALPILLSSLLGTSIPSFLLALALQVAAIRFYQQTGIRLISLGGFSLASIWIPGIVLAARPLAQISRVTFFSISEALEQDYVRTALSKGVRQRDVFRRHVYRNVAIPVLTTLVTSLRFALISLPVVEYFFSWPGAGEALLRAIRVQDDALVYGLLLCLGLLLILMNALLEGLYRLLNPLLRDGGLEQGREVGPRAGLRAVLGELWFSVLESAPIGWVRRLLQRSPSAGPSAFSQLVHQRALEYGSEDLGSLHRRERRRAWFRAVLLNPPLLLGLILLVPLLGLVVLGPFLAPHNPYNTVGVRFADGTIQTPPFEPGDEFPWGTDVLGRDIYSLILSGAQQTLVIAAIVVLARVGLGSLLGLLAGWFQGSWFDHLVGNLIEIIAAFPALLCAMVLILALGIRRGTISFVVALCFVGWGEVAQFVRAQVVEIKPRLFIEAAVVIGARWPQILSSHVLPNLLSPLVGLAALEMGAVLMLLGELGFVGIFIGGGAFAELAVAASPYYYSDVPEWAALLANIRSYARSYSWMAWPPALAFAVTILAFNLTGEGILRLIERVGASFTRLLNRYTALAALLFIALIAVVRTQTGAVALYRPLVETFDGRRALEHVQFLASPELSGRRPGTEGLDRAAQYIAAQFEALGIDPAGEDGGYFQEVERTYVALTAPPTLSLQGEDGSVLQSWTWQRDFNPAMFYPYRVDGQGVGEIVFVGLGALPELPQATGSYYHLQALSLEDKVVLVPDRRTYEALKTTAPVAGALIVSDEPDELGVFTLGTVYQPSHFVCCPNEWTPVTPRHPVLLITREVAETLVAGSGTTLEALEREAAQLDNLGILERPLGKTVVLEVPGKVHEVQARNVLAYIPGGTGTGGSAGEAREALQKMDDQMLVLMTPYDSVGVGPEGILFPGAQDGAAGVATLLELARSWKEADYRPKRAVLFVAYVDQGVPPDRTFEQRPDPKSFLQARRGFSAYKIWSIFELGHLGAADGDRLVVDTASTRLGRLIVQSARRVGVRVLRIESVVDLEAIQERGTVGMGEGEDFVQAGVYWEGGTPTWGSSDDGPEHVSAESLERAGRALSLALMVLGREWNY